MISNFISLCILKIFYHLFYHLFLLFCRGVNSSMLQRGSSLMKISTLGNFKKFHFGNFSFLLLSCNFLFFFFLLFPFIVNEEDADSYFPLARVFTDRRYKKEFYAKSSYLLWQKLQLISNKELLHPGVIKITFI